MLILESCQSDNSEVKINAIRNSRLPAARANEIYSSSCADHWKKDSRSSMHSLVFSSSPLVVLVHHYSYSCCIVLASARHRSDCQSCLRLVVPSDSLHNWVAWVSYQYHRETRRCCGEKSFGCMLVLVNRRTSACVATEDLSMSFVVVPVALLLSVVTPLRLGRDRRYQHRLRRRWRSVAPGH